MSAKRLDRTGLRSDRIWLNGGLVPFEEAAVHVLAHGIHYGTGVFEGVRVYATMDGAAFFRLEDHLRRLQYSARAYGIDIPYSPATLREAAHAVVAANGFDAAYVRPLVLRGQGAMALEAEAGTVVAIAAWELPRFFGRVVGGGISVETSSWTKIPSSAVVADAKACGHYLNSVLAKRDAEAHGFDEALLLDEGSFVLEASSENVFAVFGRKLVTPPADGSIIDGVTRRSVIELAASLSLPVTERPIARSELDDADELFLTGTGAEIAPVARLDGIELEAPGPVTCAVQSAFLDAVSGHSPPFSHWLEAVQTPSAARRSAV
jgi:branched-chain amino acid aminotransferase